MRAVVVLPTPRTPVRMKAWAIRPVAIAFDRVRHRLLPDELGEGREANFRARTRYAAAESLILKTVSDEGIRTTDEVGLVTAASFRT